MSETMSSIILFGQVLCEKADITRREAEQFGLGMLLATEGIVILEMLKAIF